METTRAELNPYRPPAATLVDAVEPADSADAALYVVAPHKFLLLTIGTFGGYTLYWFYRNWTLLNRKHQSYWPVMRAIFAIFFTHALFREVEGILERKRIAYDWSPSLLAGTYVMCSVMDRIVTRAIDDTAGAFISIALVIPTVWALFRAQKAINAAEEDPAGTSNSAITLANGAWLLLGVGVWVLLAVGLFAPE